MFIHVYHLHPTSSTLNHPTQPDASAGLAFCLAQVGHFCFERLVLCSCGVFGSPQLLLAAKTVTKHMANVESFLSASVSLPLLSSKSRPICRQNTTLPVVWLTVRVPMFLSANAHVMSASVHNQTDKKTCGLFFASFITHTHTLRCIRDSTTNIFQYNPISIWHNLTISTKDRKEVFLVISSSLALLELSSSQSSKTVILVIFSLAELSASFSFNSKSWFLDLGSQTFGPPGDPWNAGPSGHKASHFAWLSWHILGRKILKTPSWSKRFEGFAWICLIWPFSTSCFQKKIFAFSDWLRASLLRTWPSMASSCSSKECLEAMIWAWAHQLSFEKFCRSNWLAGWIKLCVF